MDESPFLKADGYVCEEVFWAGQDEFKKIAAEDLIWGIRDDILTVFELVKRDQTMKGKLESWSWS